MAVAVRIRRAEADADIARVADVVAIGVFLTGVRDGGTVVHAVAEAIAVGVGSEPDAGVAGVADEVAVRIVLGWIGRGGAVVARVAGAVAVEVDHRAAVVDQDAGVDGGVADIDDADAEHVAAAGGDDTEAAIRARREVESWCR